MNTMRNLKNTMPRRLRPRKTSRKEGRRKGLI